MFLVGRGPCPLLFVSVTSTDNSGLTVYRNIRARDLVGCNGLFIAEGKVVLSVLLGLSVFRAQSLLVVENICPIFCRF